MTEYIEREEINKAMKEVCDDPSCPMHVAAEIAQIIDCAPTADVVPVVHGWWNATETCSLCGEKSTEGLDATTWNYWLPNYCPHCGARMDGGEDND